MSDSILTRRHDFLLLFEVTNGNPNGDPDAGNMPRLDPNTNRGIVSDVCLKRKVRNFVEMFPPPRESDTANGFNILIQQGNIIETEQKRAEESVKAAGSIAGDTLAERIKNWLCREFYDVRTFGCVLSTGSDVMKGSAYGQVRGPIQITFGQSFHSITPLEVAISVCTARTEAVGKGSNAPTEEEIAKSISSQTGIQGRKHIIPYALYAAKGYVSPAFAERTGFTATDLDLLFEALLQMFEHDRSAARGEMIVRGLYDFEHVGTQHPNNAEQNDREARLGCYHAHKLLEGVRVGLREDKAFPESFADYSVSCEWTEQNLPLGIQLNLRHEGTSLGPRRA
ncbi:MAG: type I-C CRISPR-associated protein Cas7/Csd2 [Terracidiphilus sp.]|jgi:CRISPR-associated protein Csd2